MDNAYNYDNLPTPLSKEQEKNLFLKMRNGDETAREKLITHNIKLVIYCIRKKFNNYLINFDEDDLVSAGMLGLINAIDKYEIDRNTLFASFAMRCIENATLEYLEKNSQSVPTISLNTPKYSIEDGSDDELIDYLQDEHSDFVADYENKEVYRLINEVVNSLPEKKRNYIKLYFGFDGKEPQSGQQIANIYGVSRAYISAEIIRTLRDLKKIIIEKELIEEKDDTAKYFQRKKSRN